MHAKQPPVTIAATTHFRQTLLLTFFFQNSHKRIQDAFEDI